MNKPASPMRNNHAVLKQMCELIPVYLASKLARLDLLNVVRVS